MVLFGGRGRFFSMESVVDHDHKRRARAGFGAAVRLGMVLSFASEVMFSSPFFFWAFFHHALGFS